jgi:Serine hydrolase (FSH1)
MMRSFAYGTVFVDAPHILEPVDLTGHSISLDAVGAPEASATSSDPALKSRGWWRSDATRTRTDGLEESLALLRDILKTQRFEVRHPISWSRRRDDLTRDGSSGFSVVLICRGSSGSGEAWQAHKVTLHSRSDPGFRALCCPSAVKVRQWRPS